MPPLTERDRYYVVELLDAWTNNFENLGPRNVPADGATVEGFNFVEDVDGTDHHKYLWCNAAYAFGARLTRAFEDFGWCAAIRGVEGGGLVEDLPTHTFKTDEGEVALKCPT